MPNSANQERDERARAAQALIRELSDKYWIAVEQPSGLEHPEAAAAWDAVDALMKLRVVAAWLTAALAEHATTDFRRGYLAAGPLEDLMEEADQENLNIVASALNTSGNLVDALYMVNEPTNLKGRAWLREQRRRHPRSRT